MGSAWKTVGYIASGLHQMGVMPDSDVVDYSVDNEWSKVIRSLSLDSDVVSDGLAIRVPCPSCVPKVEKHASNVGGYIWVSFRGDEKYSALELAAKWQNKVYVHLARAFSNKLYGKGSELWAVLAEKARLL